jgi:hypothetical protein
VIELKIDSTNKSVIDESTGKQIFKCEIQTQTITKTCIDDGKAYILINGGEVLSDYQLFCLSLDGEIYWSTEQKLNLDDCAIIDFSIDSVRFLGVTLSKKIEAWTLNTIYKFDARGRLIDTQMNR